MGMAGGNQKTDLDELETRFGTNLILSEKEQGGVCIERKDVEGALLGFQYTVIAEVLTAKAVKGDVFVDCFMSLWRGREGVSIREIVDRRFLARFAGKGTCNGWLRQICLGCSKTTLFWWQIERRRD
ncbi:hypothetical protein ACFXTO_045147 [Malus domestica]